MCVFRKVLSSILIWEVPSRAHWKIGKLILKESSWMALSPRKMEKGRRMEDQVRKEEARIKTNSSMESKKPMMKKVLCNRRAPLQVEIAVI